MKLFCAILLIYVAALTLFGVDGRGSTKGLKKEPARLLNRAVRAATLANEAPKEPLYQANEAPPPPPQFRARRSAMSNEPQPPQMYNEPPPPPQIRHRRQLPAPPGGVPPPPEGMPAPPDGMPAPPM